jgi:hypothetical protein
MSTTIVPENGGLCATLVTSASAAKQKTIAKSSPRVYHPRIKEAAVWFAYKSAARRFGPS